MQVSSHSEWLPLDSAQVEYEDEYLPILRVEQDRQIPLSIVFVFVFVVASMSIDRLPELTAYIRYLGILCTIIYVYSAVVSGVLVTKEILLYWCFTFWGAFGLFFAESPGFLLGNLLTVLQLCIMILIVAHYARNMRSTNILLWAMLLGCMIVAMSSFITGQYQMAEDVKRAAGFAVNSNLFSKLLLTASTISLWFFRSWKSWILKGAVIAMLLLFAILIVASGSRQGVVGFLTLLFAWFIIVYLRQIRQHPMACVAGAIMILGLLYFLWRGSAETLMAERFRNLAGAGSATGGSFWQSHVRLAMYWRGLELFAESPVFGIGLNQYWLVAGFDEHYSHSNYVEVYTGSGLVGGTIYYAMYVVLWKRLRRLGRYHLEHKAMEFIKIGKAYVITQFITDLFAIAYIDKRALIMLAILFGWSCRLEKRLTATVYSGEP